MCEDGPASPLLSKGQQYGVPSTTYTWLAIEKPIQDHVSYLSQIHEAFDQVIDA